MITGKPSTSEAEANPRLSDGALVIKRVENLGKVDKKTKTWSGKTLRFHLSVASRDIYALRMSIIRLTMGTEFEEVSVTDVDLTVVPCVYYVTMKWQGQE